MHQLATSISGRSVVVAVLLGLPGMGLVHAAAPPNDNFAASSLIPTAPASVTGTTAGATAELQEPFHGSWLAYSVWWSWTAAQSELAILDVRSASFTPVISVYTGTSLSALSLVARNAASSRAPGTAFLAQPGGTYHFAIDLARGIPGEVGLRLFTLPEASPSPDRFADRLALTGRTNVVEGANVGYGREAGEPLIPSGGAGGRSAWWSWTAPSDGWVEIETKGSLIQTMLGVYTGSALNNLGSVVGAAASAPGSDLTNRFRATAGTSYAITVDDVDGNVGYFRLGIRQPAGPPVILDSPRSQTVGRGTALTLAAAVAGDVPMSFAWIRNGEPIPGSDVDKLTLPKVLEAEAGRYEITARNASGSVTSPPFEIRLATNVVSFASRTLDVTEAEAVIVRLTRSGFDNAIQVRLRLDGTAIPGSDFQPPPAAVSFPAGVTNASFSVQSLDDAVEAPQRTLLMAIEADDTYLAGSIPEVTITQTDDDPNVRLAVVDDFSREVDQDPGLFRIVRTGSLDRELRVPLEWLGSARPGVDFETVGESIVVPVGSAETLVPVRPRTTPETGDRLVELRLAPGGTVRIRNPSSASIRLLGNRPPRLGFTSPAPWTRFSEGAPVEWAVSVVDPDGPTPGRIELFDGEARLGTFAGPPHRGRITLARGAHLLVARAVDPQGSVGDSPLVPVLVGPPEATRGPEPFLFSAPEAGSYPANVAGSDDSLDVTSSLDGRWIAFSSRAADLLEFPPGRDYLGFPAQLYLHELDTGKLQGLSWNGAAESGRGDSFGARFAADAPRLVFESLADNLAPYDENGGADVFLANLSDGTPLLVSARDQTPDVTGAGASRSPSISGDGQRVAFQSEAADLVAGDTNGFADIFLRRVDLALTELISRPASGVGLANGPSESPVLSRNGRRLAFLSRATNLVEGALVNSVDLLVRDLQTGTLWSARESVLDAIRGWSLPGRVSYRCYDATFDNEGSRLAFKAELLSRPGLLPLVFHQDFEMGATIVVTTNAALAWVPTNDPTLSELSGDGLTLAYESTNHVFVWNATTRSARSLGVHPRTGLTLPGRSWAPRLSSDGRTVVFLSDAADLVQGVADNLPRAYRHDLATGITTVAVLTADGVPAPFPDAAPPELSGDGHVLGFTCSVSGLVWGDANGRMNAFARIGTGTNRLLSARAPGRTAPSPAIDEGPGPGRVSADGRFLAVTTATGAWDVADTNEIWDVYRVDRVDGSRIRASATPGGGASSVGARRPAISADGQVMAFVSRAGDLIADDKNGGDDVFVRDIAAGQTVLASSNSLGRASIANGSLEAVAGSPLLSPDGQWVAFVSGYSDLVSGSNPGLDLFLRHWRSGALVRVTNAWSSANSKTIIPLAFAGPSNVVYLHSATNVANVFLLRSDAVSKLHVAFGPVLGRPGVTLSARFASIRRRLAPDFPAVLVDLSDGREVAAFPTGLAATNLAVADVALSGDGSRFAFETARDLDPTRDRNGTKDVYVWDARWPSPRLASVDVLGTHSGNAAASRPVLSADGRFVGFASAASNLAPGLRGGTSLWLHDLESGKTWPVSDLNPGPGLGGAYGAMGFFADTPQLLFRSLAAQLSGESQGTPRPILAFSVGQDPDRDLDGDRLEDGWEFRQFGHLTRDGSSDSDADGWSDLQEFWLGTDPRRPGPGLVLAPPFLDSANAGVLVLEWPAASGRRYRIEATQSIASGDWTVIASDLRPPGALGSFRIALPASPPDAQNVQDPAATPIYRFYRVVLTP